MQVNASAKVTGDLLNLAGIPISSPLGVAAGYDKNCERLDYLLGLGFGYVVGGTVTLNPRLGNSPPCLVRVTRDRGNC